MYLITVSASRLSAYRSKSGSSSATSLGGEVGVLESERVLARRGAEGAAVLAGELGGAGVSHGVPGACDVRRVGQVSRRWPPVPGPRALRAWACATPGAAGRRSAGRAAG